MTHVAQQGLGAPGARSSLAGLLGLGRKESLTPDKRDACLILRNEATWGAF